MFKSSSLKAQRLSRFPAGRVLHVYGYHSHCFDVSIFHFINTLYWVEISVWASVQTPLEPTENRVSEDGIHPLPLPFACTVYLLLPGSQERLSHPACLWGDLLEHWSPLLVEGGIGNHSLSARLWWTKWNVGWISRSARVPADTLPLNGQGSSIITPCGANRRPSPSSIVCIH